MLVKYCKEEHNILSGCQTIKLGTLREYRENYPGFVISDPEEGLAGFKVKAGETVEITEKDADKFPFASGLKKGVMSFEAPPNIDGHASQEFPNSYIYCLKEIGEEKPSMAEAKAIDKTYDSYCKTSYKL